jgi:purine-nucleoside phosphorylase
VIAVSDHANLTWESPLTGPNDDRLGPRFPVTAGMYAPERVTLALAAEAGVVAGVWDERRLSPFEAGVVAGGRFAAVSAELASVAVVAAHLGYRVAAAVLVPGAVGARPKDRMIQVAPPGADHRKGC